MRERVRGLLLKEKEKRDRLKELQIAYNFPGFAALVKDLKPAKADKVKAPVVAEVKKPVVAEVKKQEKK